jgi:hypothetical protein
MSFLTPVGRLVNGSPFTPQTKDRAGNPLIIKSGPNAGQPGKRWWFALAIAKNNPGWPALEAEIKQVARAAWPQLFNADGQCNRKFAWKYLDGDSSEPNENGNKPCDNEGYPGHWVLNFSGSILPVCYGLNGEEILTDPNRIQLGDYIRVHGSITSNLSSDRPGIFMNYTPHMAVEWRAHGERIQQGPNAREVFGNTSVDYMPPGASETPVDTAVPSPQPPPVAPLPPPPAPDFANPPLYEIQGTKYTKQQLLDANYTEAQIATLPTAF